MKAAKMIRSLLDDDNYVITVEHDLSILDYISDSISIIYGAPGAFGVVTSPFPVGDGINCFLSGSIPNDEYKFRDFELKFIDKS
jgi:ATP-binding cassette subfamily E protein 1